MREYFEIQKSILLGQVSAKDPETERTLKEAFGKALDSAFEDLEKNGVQADSEERFWKGLSQLLSECGCLRHGYRYFENVADKAYLALENQFRCWPPQEDADWAKNADYVQVQRLRSSSPPSRRSCGRSCGKTAWAARRSAAF